MIKNLKFINKEFQIILFNKKFPYMLNNTYININLQYIFNYYFVTTN